MYPSDPDDNVPPWLIWSLGAVIVGLGAIIAFNL